MKKTFLLFLSVLCLSLFSERSDACARVVYDGPEGMIVTGRTMDWKEDPQTNLYIFPRGMEKKGAESASTIQWTSKYGSVVAPDLISVYVTG